MTDLLKEATPELFEDRVFHDRACNRYVLGRANTRAKDCTCWVKAHADEWRRLLEVERAVFDGHLYPAHFAAWADVEEKRMGYKGSALTSLLRRLARLVEPNKASGT